MILKLYNIDFNSYILTLKLTGKQGIQYKKNTEFPILHKTIIRTDYTIIYIYKIVDL